MRTGLREILHIAQGGEPKADPARSHWAAIFRALECAEGQGHEDAPQIAVQLEATMADQRNTIELLAGQLKIQREHSERMAELADKGQRAAAELEMERNR